MPQPRIKRNNPECKHYKNDLGTHYCTKYKWEYKEGRIKNEYCFWMKGFPCKFAGSQPIPKKKVAEEKPKKRNIFKWRPTRSTYTSTTAYSAGYRWD